MLKDNKKYYENYFHIEHSSQNILLGGMETRKILENSSDTVENIKFVYNGGIKSYFIKLIMVTKYIIL